MKGNFQVSIRYPRDLIEHSNLGIYYFDQKSEKWVYAKSENNRRKQTITAELSNMDAVTIIQDLDSPKIKKLFPGNGGQYQSVDVNRIKIELEDSISGIESEESSFELTLNGNKLYPAYQPLKTISYNLDRPLEKGSSN